MDHGGCGTHLLSGAQPVNVHVVGAKLVPEPSILNGDASVLTQHLRFGHSGHDLHLEIPLRAAVTHGDREHENVTASPLHHDANWNVGR